MRSLSISRSWFVVLLVCLRPLGISYLYKSSRVINSDTSNNILRSDPSDGSDFSESNCNSDSSDSIDNSDSIDSHKNRLDKISLCFFGEIKIVRLFFFTIPRNLN